MGWLVWFGLAAASWLALWLILRGVYAERLRCLRQQAERYKRLAYTDPLTGAANRLAFEERLEALKSAEESVAIASLNLNDLKAVNDAYGHVAGDRLLRKAAGVLAANCTGRAEVYRVGGDEFCLLATGMQKPCAERLFSQLEAALQREAVDMALGWEHLDCAAAGSLEMLRTRSDKAMYRAKRAGKNVGRAEGEE